MRRYYLTVILGLCLINSVFATQADVAVNIGGIPQSATASLTVNDRAHSPALKKNNNKSELADSSQNSSAEIIQIYCGNQTATNRENQKSEVENKSQQGTGIEWPKISEWLTFLEKLVEALAWPIITLVLFIKVMPDIKKLIPLLKKLRWGPIEAEFNQKINELEKVTMDVGSDQEESMRSGDLKEEMFGQAKIEPRLAVLRAWREVEAAAKVALTNKGLPIENLKTGNISDALNKYALLNRKELSLYEELLELRDKLEQVADFNPSISSSKRFIDLATRLISKLTEQTADSIKREDDLDVSKLNESANTLMRDKNGVQL